MKRVLFLSALALLFSCQQSDGIKVKKAREAMEGDGAKVKRLFPVSGFRNLDPFILIDEFNVSPDAGFPTHHHRGFEAITYMLHGTFNHKDNLGNESTVNATGAQHFNAGKGMMHSEMPGKEERNHGLQLWINIPKAKKKMNPYYQEIPAGTLPYHKKKGYHERVVVGEGSALTTETPVDYRHIIVDKILTFDYTPQEGYQGFVYVLEGKPVFESDSLSPGEAVVVKAQEKVELKTRKGDEFVLIFGKKLNEPINHRGPFVD